MTPTNFINNLKGHFTLWPKVKRPSNCKKLRVWSLDRSHNGRSPKAVVIVKDYFLKKATDSRRKFGLDRNGNPNYGWEAIGFFFIKKSIIDKILAVRLEGLFRASNKVGCSFGFGLWAWPLEASHYTRPKAPLTIFYWLFSAHFFGLSTKFGHSIPQPLDLDGHSVKRP
jgi:hypothetical protein